MPTSLLSREGRPHLLLAEGGADVLLHHGDGAGVVAAIGDDDVGVLLKCVQFDTGHRLELVVLPTLPHCQNSTQYLVLEQF